MYQELKKWLDSPEPRKRQAAKLALDASLGMAADLGMTEADVIALLEGPEESKGQQGTFIDEYVATVKQALSASNSQLPGDVYFNTFPTDDFNACARVTPNGFLCLLNQGLCELLYNVSLACVYPLRAGTGEELFAKQSELVSLLPSPQDLATDPKFAEALAVLVVTIYKYLRYEVHDQVSTLSEKFPRWAASVAAGMSIGMRTFAVAHEIAHVKLGHLNAAKIRRMIPQSGPLEVASKSQDQEFHADMEAQMILLNIDANRYHPIFPPHACGGLCFFAVASMIEAVAPKLLPLSVRPPTCDTHPKTHARLDILRRLLARTLSGSDYNYLMNIYALFDRYTQLLATAEVEKSKTGYQFKFALQA